ncbi:hypothetical protein [Streptosporangium sp. V21-05]|uniref:hypothetical protein n=1 Tax=Streptosporangium sp. V21-05 TaxID=3446115 RepID=UPI003F530097
MARKSRRRGSPGGTAKKEPGFTEWPVWKIVAGVLGSFAAATGLLLGVLQIVDALRAGSERATVATAPVAVHATVEFRADAEDWEPCPKAGCYAGEYRVIIPPRKRT